MKIAMGFLLGTTNCIYLLLGAASKKCREIWTYVMQHPKTVKQWTNKARMCKQYQLSDRAGAFVISILQDMGTITCN